MSSRLIAILALAALLRFGLLALAYPEPGRVLREDSTGSYVPLSHTLLSHGRFATAPDAKPDLFRTPGYPAFLAATIVALGDSIWRSLAAQVVVSLITIALVWSLARELVSERAAWVAGLVAALDPPTNTHAVLYLTETVFTALFALGCLGVWRAARRDSLAWAAAGGLALGVSVLVRPIALYVAPLGAVMVALAAQVAMPRRAVLAGVALALAVAPPVAWMARNASLGAGFLLTSIEGQNLLYYRAAPVLAQVRGMDWQSAMDELSVELKRRANGAPENGQVESAAAKQLALEVLRSHPGATAKMVAEGVVRFWGAPGNADLMLLLGVIELGHQARWPERGPAWLQALGRATGVAAMVAHLAILALAAWGIYAFLREKKWLELLFTVGLLAVFTLLSAGPGAYARFRVPVVPLLALLAAAAYERRRGGAA